MTTTSPAKSGRQIALPIHVHPTSIVAVDPKIRAAVAMVLARLLPGVAAASGRRRGCAMNRELPPNVDGAH